MAPPLTGAQQQPWATLVPADRRDCTKSDEWPVDFSYATPPSGRLATVAVSVSRSGPGAGPRDVVVRLEEEPDGASWTATAWLAAGAHALTFHVVPAGGAGDGPPPPGADHEWLARRATDGAAVSDPPLGLTVSRLGGAEAGGWGGADGGAGVPGAAAYPPAAATGSRVAAAKAALEAAEAEGAAAAAADAALRADAQRKGVSFQAPVAAVVAESPVAPAAERLPSRTSDTHDRPAAAAEPLPSRLPEAHGRPVAAAAPLPSHSTEAHNRPVAAASSLPSRSPEAHDRPVPAAEAEPRPFATDVAPPPPEAPSMAVLPAVAAPVVPADAGPGPGSTVGRAPEAAAAAVVAAAAASISAGPDAPAAVSRDVKAGGGGRGGPLPALVRCLVIAVGVVVGVAVGQTALDRWGPEEDDGPDEGAGGGGGWKSTQWPAVGKVGRRRDEYERDCELYNRSELRE